jgi:hypothetical protein
MIGVFFIIVHYLYLFTLLLMKNDLFTFPK